MKKLLLSLLLFTIGSLCGVLFAQTNVLSISEKQVPEVVIKAYQTAYPNMKASKWEMCQQQYYVQIKSKGKKEKARFFSNGTWIETRSEIEADELPLSATTYLAMEYSTYALSQISYVEQKEGKPYFAVEISLKENREIKLDLIFDLGGNIKAVEGFLVSKTDTTQSGDMVATGEEIKIASVSKAPELEALTEEVKMALKKRYPRTEEILWKQKDNMHIARFTFNGQEKEAAFFSTGEQVYDGQIFDKKELPFPIEAYLKKEHPKSKLEECKRIVYDSKYKRKAVEKPKDFYRVVISEKVPKSKDVLKMILRFDQGGKFDYKSEI